MNTLAPVTKIPFCSNKRGIKNVKVTKKWKQIITWELQEGIPVSDSIQNYNILAANGKKWVTHYGK